MAWLALALSESTRSATVGPAGALGEPAAGAGAPAEASRPPNSFSPASLRNPITLMGVPFVVRRHSLESGGRQSAHAPVTALSRAVHRPVMPHRHDSRISDGAYFAWTTWQSTCAACARPSAT